jgi:hypothetical protein
MPRRAIRSAAGEPDRATQEREFPDHSRDLTAMDPRRAGQRGFVDT